MRYPNYIDYTFARMDIKEIRSFLIDGLDEFDQNSDTYVERLKKGSDPLYKRMEAMYTNEEELGKANADISKAVTAYESVYMELGMKAGARLVHQLLISN